VLLRLKAGFCRSYGLECLFRFYSYGLEKKYRADLYFEFEELVREDLKSGALKSIE
jgi:la-related protein 1